MDLRQSKDETEMLIGGRYRVLECIGHGPRASVYLVTDAALDGEQLAIKLFHPQLFVEAGVRSALQQQVVLSRQLSHKNIVRIFDLEYREGEAFFLAQEYVQGWSLAQLLEERRRSPFPYDAAVRYFLLIAQALEHAHRAGVVHADLKPENILISREAELKVSDFGIAKALESSLGLTATGQTIASPQFMSPEQFAGAEPSPASDVYALGILAWRLLSGTNPFAGMTFIEVANTQINQPLGSICANRSDLPMWLEEVVSRCTQKDPKKRFESGTQLVAELSQRLDDAKIKNAKKSCRRLLPSAAWSTNRKVLLTLIPATLIAGIAIFTLLLSQAVIRRDAAGLFLRLEEATQTEWPAIKQNIFGISSSLSRKEELYSFFKNRDYENARALLNAGVDPNYLDSEGRAVFDHLFNGGVHEIAGLLFNSKRIPQVPETFQPNFRNGEGQTFLHVSALNKQSVFMTLYLKNGALPSLRDSKGYTPLHYSAQAGDLNSIAELMKYGADIDERTSSGETALMLVIKDFRDPFAVEYRVKRLIELGASTQARDDRGLQAVDYATAQELPEVVHLLTHESTRH